MLSTGKVNVIIDGQYGSTGKGLLAGYLGCQGGFDVAAITASPNSGHTCLIGDRKIVTSHLPISGLVHEESVIYLTAASTIHMLTFIDEVKKYKVRPGRLIVHPRATIISDDDILAEGLELDRIGSTKKGAGYAAANKLRRKAWLAEHHEYIDLYATVAPLENVKNDTILMEVPQGFDLSINSGLSYPYCTSREVTVSQALSDLGAHPRDLGKVFMTLRTYPIRVANPVDHKGEVVGTSGPCYDDQHEITWESLGVEPELTTVTKKVRRVFTFSEQQTAKALSVLRPDFIFLNFMNYLRDTLEWNDLMVKIQSRFDPGHVPEFLYGFGPQVTDVITDRTKVCALLGLPVK